MNSNLFKTRFLKLDTKLIFITVNVQNCRNLNEPKEELKKQENEINANAFISFWDKYTDTEAATIRIHNLSVIFEDMGKTNTKANKCI